jgi:polysaccharide biosynthesis/export protein
MRIVWDICAPAARSCVALILLALAAVIPQFALAQANPTPAQLEAFRNLPADQQRAVLEAASASGIDASRVDQPLATPPLTAPAPKQEHKESESGLKQFGYDLFDQVPTTFAPATDIPVPADYTVGPGDTFIVDLFGKKTGHYTLVVDRNGALTLPEFGPIQVTGLGFDQVRSEIEQRCADQMIGVRASVTMGPLRSIRIFVVGDVVRPGTYTVSGLSTATNALFASGGISRVGSLRDIELKRGRSTVARIDLYDLLLRGDTSSDLKLEPGDALFVPPVGATAGIAGQVRRPAIYEFRGKATVADLLQLAGGLDPEADPKAARLERIDQDLRRTVINLDLTTPAGRNRQLRSGDVVSIPRVLDDLTRSVFLEGHVVRPGKSAWYEGMRLTDLLGALDAFKLNADQRYVLIRREHLPSRRIEALSADAREAFAARGSVADPLIQNGDHVIAFSREGDRGQALADVMQEMRTQVRDNQPMPVVSINGRVRAGGSYPLEAKMTVSDLIRAGGGLDDAAYALTAELTRYEVVNGAFRKTEVIELDLAGDPSLAPAAVLASNEVPADVPVQGRGVSTQLRAYDMLVIKETPEWREQESITLRGEVRFPGVYPVKKGETLSSVVQRAGGLTDHAYVEGAVFTREEIKTQEKQQVDNLADRLESDLTLVALQGAQTVTEKQNPAEALAVGQSLLAQLRNAKPTGRLVIDLDEALHKTSSDADIELRDGDVLLVPPVRQYVTVIGEVQSPTSHVWRRDLDRNDYLAMSGGPTRKADDDSTYVVRADGSVVPTSNRKFFGGSNIEMQPGDTVVVPLHTDKMRPLPLWTAVTTIVYNMAVAVAAIGSL